MQRFSALFLALCVLACGLYAAMPQAAFAHGGSHSPAPAAVERPAPPQETRAVAALADVTPRASIAHTEATAPSHCPGVPGGGCDCGHAACAGPVLSCAAPELSKPLLLPAACASQRVPGNAPAPRSFILSTAPPRAPPDLAK